jgi:hypothetical protein
MAIRVEQQQKVAEAAGAGPIAGYVVATLNEWNVVLETGVLILGFISGLFTVYFFVNRFLKERKAKSKE